MGKMKEDPKYNVFTFRAADQDAEDIQQAAKAYESMSDFLLTAAVEKARADYVRDYRARVDNALHRSPTPDSRSPRTE